MTGRRALSEMKVYILDIVKSRADHAAAWFRDKLNVEVVNQSFEAFMSDADVDMGPGQTGDRKTYLLPPL